MHFEIRFLKIASHKQFSVYTFENFRTSFQTSYLHFVHNLNVSSRFCRDKTQHFLNFIIFSLTYRRRLLTFRRRIFV